MLLLLTTTLAVAYDFDTEISDEDKEEYDGILEPVAKIYNFIKYGASLIGAVFLIMAGIVFISSSGDQRKRETAKAMAGYTIIGLGIVWVAPLIVNFITG